MVRWSLASSEDWKPLCGSVYLAEVLMEEQMESTKDLAERAALHGERMLEISVRFWTNDIAVDEGNIVPKHAWTSGVISLVRNKSHDIEPLPPKPFHTLMDLSGVIEQVLIAHGV
ncbi:MAG TPA: hypothetical protein VEU51_07560, partial [Candidatus Acidoferrales bacterium]|nr:hypothetical protein [Candidatus Acidoferrales bacterium]